jgi:hypothetical protein
MEAIEGITGGGPGIERGGGGAGIPEGGADGGPRGDVGGGLLPGDAAPRSMALAAFWDAELVESIRTTST